MIERTIAKRYAKALLEVSVRERRVRETESELLALADLHRASPDFKTALESPLLPRAQKKALAGRALAGKVGPSVVSFLQVLVEEGRAGFLPEIAEAFDLLADAHEGVVAVSVRSARALTPAQLGRLRESLVKLAGGRAVRVDVQVDPALLAGVLIRVGDTVIDGTAAGRLTRLKEHLMLAGRR